MGQLAKQISTENLVFIKLEFKTENLEKVENL